VKNYRYFIVTKYYELCAKLPRIRNAGRSCIYMFHQISGCKTDTKKFITNYIDFDRFLQREMQKRSAVSIQRLCGKRDSYSKPFFVITFDDGFDGIYKFAYPTLIKRGVPFTIFVTTGFIDQPGYLTKKELFEMVTDPLCTIGAHTRTHPILRNCNVAFDEMRGSKETLEGWLHRPIEFFAYPYGSVYACSMKNRIQAKCAGFRTAFSSIEGYLTFFSLHKRFFLPRITGDKACNTINE